MERERLGGKCTESNGLPWRVLESAVCPKQLLRGCALDGSECLQKPCILIKTNISLIFARMMSLIWQAKQALAEQPCTEAFCNGHIG